MTHKQFNELKKEFYTLTPRQYTIAELDAIHAIIKELAETDKSDTFMQGIIPFFKSIEFLNIEPTYIGFKITVVNY